MTTAHFDSIHLHRIEPARNMARFYLVTIERTLFGETVVRRSWGRIGTHGRSCTMVIDASVVAEEIAAKLGAAKRRRGYCDVHQRR